MSRHRFFLQAALQAAPDGEGVVLPLSADDVHHALHVLRVREGEELDVVEPGGAVWRVRVRDVESTAIVADAAQRLPGDTPAALPQVTLVFGVSKGSKNDDIVEGATEVGVAGCMPVLCARSIVKLDAQKRAQRGERWRRVAHAAAKQSKRATVPDVTDPADLADALPLLAAFDLVLVAWEEASAGGRGVRAAISSAKGALSSSSRIAVVVGPEGGLAADEVALLAGIGGEAVTLGETILRAETAAVVASALVVHELREAGLAL
jgi:16S rRNA (uracil1498-N3)-methyltransferase